MASETSPHIQSEPGVNAKLTPDQEADVQSALRQELYDPNSWEARRAASLQARQEDEATMNNIITGREVGQPETPQENPGIIQRLAGIFRGNN